MGPWLALALWLGCAPRTDAPIHAEAWVSPGRLAPEALPPLLSASPLSVDGPGLDGRFRVVATEPALAALEARGLEVQRIRADHRRPVPAAPEYHDPEEMEAELRALAEAHPEQAELVDIGRSVEGRTLWALRVGSGDWRVRILAAHHGDELSSAELALALARRLLDSPVQPELWIVPQVNPDGVARGSRYNAHEVDLNRNYGYQWSATEYRAGDEPFSEPEARAVRVLSSYRGFGTGLSMHSGAALIAYIWNYTTQDSPDEALLLEHSEDYTRACALGGFYSINGGRWYVTHGDTTDWSYGRQGTLDYTLEVSVEKTPPPQELPELFDDHLEAMLEFVQRPPAVMGEVYDATDGQPVQATITVDGAWESFSDPDGRFARWLPDGEATLSFQAPGYQPTSVSVAPGGEPEQVAVALERAALPALRPEPALLSWSGREQSFELPELDDASVTLFRLGYPDHTVPREGEGYAVVTRELAPGPWGIRTSIGERPRVLFIGERDDRVQLSAVDWQGDRLLVWGEGFEQGSAAWAVVGERRRLVPLRLLEEGRTSLELSASSIQETQDLVDLVVVSSGAQLSALDLAGEGSVDTGAPGDTEAAPGDSDPGPRDSGPGAPGGGACGCGAGARPPVSTSFLLALATIVGLRRRRRNPRPRRMSEKDGAVAAAPAAPVPWELR